ncbi:MAG: ankyrin repeat domain-containing protein [Candidatus Brocadiaceae bacterium]|nr:ankyrin repeat domain-containing protein [Candidatus Brocadiaceae bacterium]
MRKTFIFVLILLFSSACVETQLIKEVEKGNIANVKTLISQRKNVNSKGREGITPLMKASDYGRLKIVKLLLENGSKVNQKSNYDWTALMFAIYPGHLDVAKYLIEKGADINFKTKEVPSSFFATSGGVYATTPLIYAAKYNHFHMVKLLVENGADVNVIFGSQRSAFYEAAKNGNLDMLKYLEKHGADINLENKYHNLIGSAAKGGYLDVLKWLIENKAVTISIDGCSIIVSAASGGHLDVVKWLVEFGVDANCENDIALIATGSSYLRHGKRFGKEKFFPVIKYFVENGANVNVCNSYTGYTALIYVIPDIKIVKYLIENGADPSIGNVKLNKNNERGNAFAKCEYEIKRLEDRIAISKKKGEDIDVSDIERLNKYREVLKYLVSVRDPS